MYQLLSYAAAIIRARPTRHWHCILLARKPRANRFHANEGRPRKRFVHGLVRVANLPVSLKVVAYNLVPTLCGCTGLWAPYQRKLLVGSAVPSFKTEETQHSMPCCEVGQLYWASVAVTTIILLYVVTPANSSRILLGDEMGSLALGYKKLSEPSGVLTSEQLNCTEDDFANLVYRGYECHNRDVWPGSSCPAEGVCLPHCPRCINWRHGELALNRPPLVGSTSNVTEASKIPCDSTIWGFGRWLNDTWVPSEKYPQCSSAPLTPGVIYDCLRGKRVFLFGDSTTRPLLGRLVAYLRGFPAFIDRWQHEPGNYYMANGTHDAFAIGHVLPSLHHSKKAMQPPVPESTWDLRTTMELQFFWAPKFVRDGTLVALHEHMGVLKGADIMIAGPMYHVRGDYEAFRDALTYYFKLLAWAGKRITQFFWLSTVAKGTEEREVLDEYVERNYLMETFVLMLNDHALQGEVWPPKHSYFVDAMRMSLRGNISRRDRSHYHCMLTQTSQLKGASDNNTDCRDPFNLNVMQTILKVACSR